MNDEDEVQFAWSESDEELIFDVVIPPEVAEQFNALLAEHGDKPLPPVEELVMKVRIDTCSICGGDAKEGIGAIEPDYVTGDGVLYGKVICNSCLRKGE